jgi:hypothetical protein
MARTSALFDPVATVPRRDVCPSDGAALGAGSTECLFRGDPPVTFRLSGDMPRERRNLWGRSAP